MQQKGPSTLMEMISALLFGFSFGFGAGMFVWFDWRERHPRDYWMDRLVNGPDTLAAAIVHRNGHSRRFLQEYEARRRFNRAMTRRWRKNRQMPKYPPTQP